MPKQSQESMVSFASLGNGAVIEKIDLEIDKLLNNVVDPNTEATKVREITIKMLVQPTEERDIGLVSVNVSSKLAPQKSVYTTMMIEQRGSLVAATERYTDRDHAHQPD